MGKIYQVTVIGLKGEKFTVDLCNTEEQMKSMTVLQLKQKIAERLPGNAGSDVETIRLIFTSKMLEGGLLSSYGVQHLSIIQMVIRVPGGL